MLNAMKKPFNLERNIVGLGWLIGGALAGAAAGIGKSAVEGAISDESYKERADYDYKLGEKQAANAYQRQVDFWNMTNQYNTPANQRNRLEAAGLNPALMYGSGSGANTAGYMSGSNQAPKSGGSSFNPRISLGDAADAAVKLASVRNIDADTSKKRAETAYTTTLVNSESIRQDLLESQVISQNLANGLADFDLSLKKELRANTVELSNQNVSRLANENNRLNAEIVDLMNRNAAFPERLGLLRQQYALNNANIGALEARAALARSGVNLNESQIRLIEERIQVITAEISRTTSEISNIQSSTALNWQTFERSEPATKGAQKRFNLENARLYQMMGIEVVNSVVQGVGSVYGAGRVAGEIKKARQLQDISTGTPGMSGYNW